MRDWRGLPLLLALLACRPHGAPFAPAGTGPTGAITTTVPVPEQAAVVAGVELILPPEGARVGSVPVLVNRGLDEYAFDNREWRAMCARARCAMLRLTLPRQDALPPVG
jgi:hypothetical protein